MPKIVSAPDTMRKQFRATLPSPQREVFDRLAALVDHTDHDLVWYHQLGSLILKLRAAVADGGHGLGWVNALAAALGPGESVLRKAARLAELYPSEKALRAVAATGADWTKVSLVLAVRDRTARHALLREATRRGWSPQQLRFEAQSRYPTNRRGVGGRPRKPTRGLDPEGVLRELGRLTERWVEFHGEVFGEVGPEEWVGLGRATDPGRRAALRALVSAAEVSLRDLERAVRAARATVRQVGRAVGARG